MLGLGETDAEIRECMDDLRARRVDILTLGQYLRPTVHHLPVERFVTPEEFARATAQWALDARISRMRVRPAGALELPRRAGAGGQQRRPARRQAAARVVRAVCSAAAPGMRVRSGTRAGALRADLARDAAIHRRARCGDADEIWLLEHEPVFTLGMNAEPRARARIRAIFPSCRSTAAAR